MTTVRVMLLSNAITPDRQGGLERHCRELGGALSHKGADVVIHARRVDPRDPEHCVDADGVEIWRFDTPSKDNPLYALGYPAASAAAVRAAVRATGGARVMHSNFPLQGLALAASRTPYIHTFQAPVHRELLSEHQGTYALPGPAKAVAVKAMRLGESRVVRAARELVVLSDFMRAEAIALGARPESITVLPGGIDTERFSPGPPVTHPWAEAEGPLLFTARRMVPRTGVTELIEAFGSISEEVEGARLAVAGRGPLEDEIRARVDALGLSGQVLMLGWVSDEELLGWYRAADLVVMPTQELEGFGLTTAEALACGTPVVGTPVGANPEVLRRLDPALGTRDASAQAIAERVVELLREPERLAALAARARAAVHPALGWSSVADQYLALYERHQAEVGGVACTAENGARRNGVHAPGRPARAPDASLVSILVSPVSGARLVAEPKVLRTIDEQERFPVVDGVPVLLASDSAFSLDAYREASPKAPTAKTYLRGILPSLSHNLSAERNLVRLRELLHEQTTGEPPRVLVVGGATIGAGMASLVEDPSIRLVEADVAMGPRTDLICDAHSLPFADGSFDGVVCQAVLEHVADPPCVVAEVHRVLKPGGLVYSEIPFMQQVHEGAYDFTRYSYNGQRRLFNRFEEIDAGATAGPGMALGWSIRALAVAFAGERAWARTLANALSTLAFFWLKYLDLPLMRGSAALDGASGLYFLGRARDQVRGDREIIAGYRGANSGFSVRR